MLNVFSADQSDINWITRLYLESAKEKHFHMDISERKNIALIKRNIKSIIDNQSMIDFNLETQTLVFEKNKKRIGYVVMSAITNMPNAAEIQSNPKTQNPVQPYAAWFFLHPSSIRGFDSTGNRIDGYPSAES